MERNFFCQYFFHSVCQWIPFHLLANVLKKSKVCQSKTLKQVRSWDLHQLLVVRKYVDMVDICVDMVIILDMVNTSDVVNKLDMVNLHLLMIVYHLGQLVPSMWFDSTQDVKLKYVVYLFIHLCNFFCIYWTFDLFVCLYNISFNCAFIWYFI